jgi:hypothetical protein
MLRLNLLIIEIQSNYMYSLKQSLKQKTNVNTM